MSALALYLVPVSMAFVLGNSTTTCLLENKDTILDVLDGGNSAVMYSLDLSAAFDMLRKDTFIKNMRGFIQDNLRNVISDFLSGSHQGSGKFAAASGPPSPQPSLMSSLVRWVHSSTSSWFDEFVVWRVYSFDEFIIRWVRLDEFRFDEFLHSLKIINLLTI